MRKGQFAVMLTVLVLGLMAIAAMNIQMIRTMPKTYFGAFNATTAANNTDPTVAFDLKRPNTADFTFGHNGTHSYFGMRNYPNVNSTIRESYWMYYYVNATSPFNLVPVNSTVLLESYKIRPKN